MALNQGRCVRIAHTRSLPERMEAARAALGTIRLRFDQIAFNFQRLARVGMSVDRLKTYTELVFPMPSDPDDLKGRRRVEAARDGCNRLFEAGKGNAAPGVRGTLWAAYNGVAEYVDHVIQYRDDHRCLDSIWFGGGYLTKARAFQLAMKSAESWKN